MAEPKRKISKERSNTRYANWKAAAPGLAECPQCHEPKQSHRACAKCGYYDGVMKISVAKKEKE